MNTHGKMKKIDHVTLTLGERWSESFLVTYPTSYRYNGGIVIDGKWYQGYKVVSPKVPKGFELVGIACGLQLNARPPYATRYLKPIDGHKVSKNEAKAAIATT